MSTPYVSTYHQSGGINFSDVIPDRVHAKIGEAETGDANKVYVINNYQQAKSTFGAGKLVDSLQQYFEEFDGSLGQSPVPVLCVRPINDTAGSVGTPDKGLSTGAATGYEWGTPTSTFTAKIKITKEGASGVAEYRLSVDGGVTYGSPVVTPASATPIALGSGATITFTDDATPADSFDVGDVWTVEVTAPTASNSSFLDALDVLKQEYRLYWIHIVKESDRAFAVSVNSVLTTMETDFHLPTFAILEAELKTSGTEAEYLQSLIDEWDPFQSDRVAIVAFEGRYVSGGVVASGGYQAVVEAGIGEWRNGATMLTARIGTGAPNVSAGWVQMMRSLTFSEIRYWATGYQDYMDTMHDMGLTVGKVYDDYEGVFIAKDKIKCHPDSDFKEIPERRRADKMHRIVYQNSLPFLNADTETKSGSGGLTYLKSFIDGKISGEMEAQGRAEISGHEIKLDPNGTFSTTRILEARLKMYIAGRIKAIEWTTSFANV